MKQVSFNQQNAIAKRKKLLAEGEGSSPQEIFAVDIKRAKLQAH